MAAIYGQAVYGQAIYGDTSTPGASTPVVRPATPLIASEVIANGSLVDILCPWGQDVQFELGDLVLIADTPYDTGATSQQVGVLLQQAASETDPVTGFVSMPDDMFNPTVGLGIRKYVDQIDIETVKLQITNDATVGLPLIPTIVSDSVAVTFVNDDPLVFEIAFTTTTGVTTTLPDNTLQ